VWRKLQRLLKNRWLDSLSQAVTILIQRIKRPRRVDSISSHRFFSKFNTMRRHECRRCKLKTVLKKSNNRLLARAARNRHPVLPSRDRKGASESNPFFSNL
jgi:hypothetical protein